jgi:hypothetical protein
MPAPISGCDPNVATLLGETPIFYAARAGSLPCVTLLLSFGAIHDVIAQAKTPKV